MSAPKRLPPDREGRFGYRERLCSKCREWWPAHADFFPYTSKSRGRALCRWCHACFAETKARSDRKRRSAAR